MNPSLLFSRQMRWLNLPGALLFALLQRSPVVQVASTAAEIVAASPVGTVLRSVMLTAASLGALHSMAGATTLTTNNYPSPLAVTAGTAAPMVVYAVKGVQGLPGSWKIGGSIPPGMSFSGLTAPGNINTSTLTLSGTPTTAGSCSATLQAFESANTKGNTSPVFTYVINVAAGSGGTSTTAPAFTTQPVSQTVTAGAAVTFTAAASGSPTPTYQWNFNGAAISSATNASFSLASAQTTDAGNYTVVATNSAGSATSSTAALVVNAATVAPAFSTQPASQTVTTGATVTFTAAASGTPAPTYQWSLNGTAIAGATSATLSLSNVQTSAAGNYTVVATNSAGSATSSTAALVVNAATIAPAFTIQPASQTVTTGATVTFTAAASGTPAPTYQWSLNGTAIAGATSATLSLSNVQSSAAGNYAVVATNSAGTVTSSTASLVVNAATAAPTFTTQPASQTVSVGATVTFTAAASGTPAPTYQWSLNNTAIAGATSATLSLSNVQTSAAGNYAVVATNSAGTVTSSTASLVVNAATPTTAAPAFTTQPASQAVSVGTTVMFTASASGTPAPTYQWSLNGTAIAGATSATLSLSNVQSSSAGNYTVVATNTAGTATSSTASLVVNATTPATTAPAFTTQPASQTVNTGATVTFVATASGTPAPTYQWSLNGTAIAGATSATLSLSNVQTSAAGNYTATATNDAGTITSNTATLIVTAAAGLPAFIMQPVSQAMSLGSTVVFNAAASNATSFQWTWNGSPIPGATNAMLVLSHLVSANAGSYACVATNTNGSSTSVTATLTVGTFAAADIGHLINVSILTTAGSGSKMLTVGTEIGGGSSTATLPLVIRAVGPSLGQFGVIGVLADPVLTVNSVGNPIPLAVNAGWGGSNTMAAEFAVVGAFPLPAPSKDSAYLALPGLAPGGYTVQVTSASNTTGNVLAEIYDAGDATRTATTPRLMNVSTLTAIDVGSSLTAGFVLSGQTSRTLLIRGIGPSLGIFGVGNLMNDPQLEFFNTSLGLKIAGNDNWGGDSQLAAVTASVGAFPLIGAASRDAVLLITLPPGSYSARVSDVAGTGGTAIVEIYEVP